MSLFSVSDKMSLKSSCTLTTLFFAWKRSLEFSFIILNIARQGASKIKSCIYICVADKTSLRFARPISSWHRSITLTRIPMAE